MIHEPRLLVCDEPTSAVDARTGQTIMELIRKIAVQPDRVAVVVTHDSRVFDFGDRIITLEDGQIANDRRVRGIGVNGTSTPEAASMASSTIIERSGLTQASSPLALDLGRS